MDKKSIFNILISCAICALPLVNSLQTVSHAAETSTVDTGTTVTSTDGTITDQSQSTITNGLQTNYFSDDIFADLVSIQWGDTDPLKNLGDDTVKSIKIVGTITADQDESLTVQSDYSTKVVIDSQVVYDSDAGKTGTIDLTSGQHQIVWTATADSGFSKDGKLEIVDSDGQPVSMTSLLPQAPEKPAPTFQTKSLLVQTDPTTGSTTATDSQIGVTIDPSATNEPDTDGDGIPDDWEINGYTFCVIDGQQKLMKWYNSDADQGCKKLVSDPNSWTTNGDPFSDLQEATGVGMPAAILAVKPNDPLVPAYPDVQVELDSYQYDINGTITTTDGIQTSGSHTTNTTKSKSETITNGGTTSLSVSNKILASLNPFQTGTDTAWTLSQNYTHSDANQTGVSNSDGWSESNAQNWSQATASNPSEAATLGLNVHYVNHGTAPVEDYVPTFNINIAGQTVDTLSPNLTATNIDPVGAADSRYPSSGSVNINKEVGENGVPIDITLPQDPFNELQEGYPMIINNVDMKQAKISIPEANGKKDQVDWGQYLSDIDNLNATIHIQSSNTSGDYLTRKVYAKPANGHAQAPTVTLGDALKRAFNATQDANGNLTINGQVIGGDGYVISGKDAATSQALYDFVNQGGNLTDFPLSPNMDIYLDHVEPNGTPEITFAQYNGNEIDAYIQGNGTIIDGVYADLNGQEVKMTYDDKQGIYVLPTDSQNYDSNVTNSVEIKYEEVDGTQHTVSKTITNLSLSPSTTIPLYLSKINDSSKNVAGQFSNDTNGGNTVLSEVERPTKLEATNADKTDYLSKTFNENPNGHTYEFQVYLKADQEQKAELRIHNQDLSEDKELPITVTTDWQKYTTGPVTFTKDSDYLRTTLYPAGRNTGTGTIYAYGAMLLKDGKPVMEYDPNLEHGPGLDYATQTAMFEIDPDTNPSVAMNNKGQVVVVSESTDNKHKIEYYTGNVQADGTIKWDNSTGSNGYLKGKDTGSTGITPNVAINDKGQVVMVSEGYNNPGDLYIRVGTLTSSGMDWSSKKPKYDTGHNPSVALTSDGEVIESHEGKGSSARNLYYTVGQIKNNEVEWPYEKVTYENGGLKVTTYAYNTDAPKSLSHVNYGDGYDPDISISKDGNIVETHRNGNDKNKIYYDLGQFKSKKYSTYYDSITIDSINWTKTKSNGKADGRIITSDNTGYAPTISVANNGVVLAAFSNKDPNANNNNSNVYYSVGKVSGDKIIWTDKKKFESARNPSVALNDNLQFITIDDDNNKVTRLGSGSLQETSATANFDNWSNHGVTLDNNTDALNVDGNTVYNLIAPGEYSYAWIVNNQDIGSTTGRTVTFSVYLRSDTEQTVRLRLKDNQDLQAKNTNVTVGPDWEKYSVTIDFENIGPSGVKSYIYPAGFGTNVAGSVQAYGATLTYSDPVNN